VIVGRHIKQKATCHITRQASINARDSTRHSNYIFYDVPRGCI